MREIVHIALCFDERVLMPGAVAIASAIQETREAQVAAHVLTTRMSAESEEFLRKTCRVFGGQELEVVRTDLAAFSGIRSKDPAIPLEMYLNFLLPQSFPELERVIYLDADVLVRGSLYPLWRIDMRGRPCMAADKAKNARHFLPTLGFDESDIYVNNGVMLLDLTLFRDRGLSARLIDCAHRNWDRVPLGDQDIFNLVMRGNIGDIGELWNFSTRDYACAPEARRKARVHHYTGTPKPWDRVVSYRDVLWHRVRAKVLWRTSGDWCAALKLSRCVFGWLLAMCLVRLRGLKLWPRRWKDDE